MGYNLKSWLIKFYHFLRYREARQLSGTGVPFEHFRELNRSWLTNSGIRTILDVGANKGQFAQLARKVFPGAHIHSFEPLPDCYGIMKDALKGDNIFFAYNKAMGKEPASMDFYRSNHSPSSSFLQMEDLHKQAFPESKGGQVKEAIKVEVDTLDHFYEVMQPEGKILLKIDVQGFESEVLEGARVMLAHVSVVIIEMSIQKLYKDQPLFHDVYSILYDLGFRYHGNLSQMLHPSTQEVVQIDALFVNERRN